MEKEHIDLYRKIYNKYCLGHINNTLENKIRALKQNESSR
jgi:hypothetical protein